MPELADRIPGEVILSSYANDIRDRTGAGQRYINLAALQASVPLPTAGDSGFLTEDPYLLTAADMRSGIPVVWQEDKDTSGPFPAGFRWVEYITGAGGTIFNALLLSSGQAGSEGPSGHRWALDASGQGNFRIRGLNMPDGLSDQTWLQLPGSGSGTGWLRLPATGQFQIRRRESGAEDRLLSVSGEDFSDGFTFWTHDENLEDYRPVLFGRIDRTGAQVALVGDQNFGGTAPRLGITHKAFEGQDQSTTPTSILYLESAVTTGSGNYRHPSAGWTPQGFPTLYAVHRDSGSSKRWKDGIDRTKANRKAMAALLGKLKPASFTYKADYLPEDDERAGVEMWGLIAEDIEKVAPGLVDHDEDGKPAQVSWRQITTLMIAAIQELQSAKP